MLLHWLELIIQAYRGLFGPIWV